MGSLFFYSKQKKLICIKNKKYFLDIWKIRVKFKKHDNLLHARSIYEEIGSSCNDCIYVRIGSICCKEKG